MHVYVALLPNLIRLTNLLIEDCAFHSRSGGIHFGASAWYDYVNVTVRRVTVMDAHGGMDIQVSLLAANRFAANPFLCTTLIRHVKKGYSTTDGHECQLNGRPVAAAALRCAGPAASSGSVCPTCS